jgi:purine-binding chemotaxis protein CheW
MTLQETAVKTVVDLRAGKYLAFHFGREEFAIQVLKVREIIGVQEITAVPNTPGCLKGGINLRGKVIPVFDLRMKFGLQEIEYTHRTSSSWSTWTERWARC